MSFPNITDVTTASIQKRSKKVQDNVTKNNGLLYRLMKKGKFRSIDGGEYILEELSFAENGNATFYSAYDLINTAAQDVISAAQFSIKQAAVAVTYSGLEILQNSGEPKMLDLVEKRLEVAEASLKNLIAQGLYSDGTGYGGKQITGLQAAVASNPTTGTYGSIDRSTTVGTFWRNQTGSIGATMTAANIVPAMNALWAKLVRGSDHPDLIVFDNNCWSYYTGNLQLLQRFGDSDLGQAGFTTLKFMNADVLLDGGYGGFAPANTGYFLNTDYIYWRPHKDRNFAPVLGGKQRASINQDAAIELIGWAGNLTCSNAFLQGYFQGS
jgi:hypothetical protein